ncbi:MAG: metallo-beta-lactamase [Acidobacteria bacterium]|nr:metallo-beta-lactamase [Acidobacteriota bacterium]
MSHFTKQRWLILLLGLAAVGAVFVLRVWARNGSGQQPAEPFQIASNFYYVGANDVTSFLITGPEGHVLIDGGYSDTPPLVLASIARLGFDIRDVKVLLNSEPHMDHAGGLSALQQASGGELWASEASANVIASGGDDASMSVFGGGEKPAAVLVGLALHAFSWIGAGSYPPARVDHRFKDGDTIRVGPIALTAHITGGHTRGCTSWSFKVRDRDRDLDVVSACSLKVALGARYPEQGTDLERSFRVLRNLPADIWVTSHARWWGRYPKFVASTTAKDPVEPFIDPEGYRAYIDTAEAEFRAGRTY